MTISNVSKANSLYYKYQSEIEQAKLKYNIAWDMIHNADKPYDDYGLKEFINAKEKLDLLIHEIRQEWLYREAKAIR